MRPMRFLVNETHTGVISAAPAIVRPAPARNIPAPIQPILAILVMRTSMKKTPYRKARFQITAAIPLFLLLTYYLLTGSRKKNNADGVNLMDRKRKEMGRLFRIGPVLRAYL
jgi:hypothetical protein